MCVRMFSLHADILKFYCESIKEEIILLSLSPLLLFFKKISSFHSATIFLYSSKNRILLVPVILLYSLGTFLSIVQK